ncbi:unnamed protein product, partial [Ectocarpus fasciculatus]
MVKKKLDPRIRGLIEAGVKKNQRSLFVLVGDHGKDQVENIHKILSKSRVRTRPSVLWCYKKELGFSSHRQKRMKQIKRNQARGLHDPDRDDPFDLFISSTDIRWTYYKDSEKVLGQTFGMCVLQDFEALTPNLLARTIETVEGGGVVIFLMKTVKSLKQLYSMSMDVHSRFRTEAYHEVIPRFNERFILSLGDNEACLVLDDELNILPISSKVRQLPSSSGMGGGLDEDEADAAGVHVDPALEELKASLSDTPHVGALVALAKTVDQAQAVMSFLDAIAEKSLRSTVALTAARGRGKSAALGLCLAGAIAYGYSNIFLTAPSPENLKTAFEFVVLGLKALKYNEHLDFQTSVESIEGVGKVIVRVSVFKEHRQTIQYILPTDHVMLAQAELVAIDEAAAIPLPVVKRLMGPYLVFMSSTVNGYEGTGRALSLKLIQQLRIQQSKATTAAATAAGAAVAGTSRGSKKGEKKLHEERWKVAAEAAASYSNLGSAAPRILTEISLDTPIRYGSEDPIESWLNNLLCMDVVRNSSRIVSGLPAPRDCELFMVNRDALFSYHAMAEGLLQRIWSLYTSAHYKNSPNDLQMLSDAPAHRLFVLLGPRAMERAAAGSSKGVALPEVLCVLQVAFEGQISQLSVQSELAKGNKASGDMIPWNISQQFNDTEFAGLSGARIVRIATHPDVQKMGYGSRAIDLLLSYFEGSVSSQVLDVGEFGGEGGEAPVSDPTSVLSLDEEVVVPKTALPPLLINLQDRPAERLHWVGVSFGLTDQLLNFWSRKGFKICYLRQTTNDLTGEHSSIVLREMNCAEVPGAPNAGWLAAYVSDYRRRLVSLMSYSFRSMPTALALTLLDPDRAITSTGGGAGSQSAAAVGRDAGSQLLTVSELLSVHLSQHDLKRLELYSRNMVDHHMILDTVPVLARLLFSCRLPNVASVGDGEVAEGSSGFHLSALQAVVLLGIGLQHRDVDDISSELNLPANQVLAFFNKTLRKITSVLRAMIEQDAETELLTDRATIRRMDKRASAMTALPESLADDQTSDSKLFADSQRAQLMKMKDLSKHAVSADD